MPVFYGIKFTRKGTSEFEGTYKQHMHNLLTIQHTKHKILHLLHANIACCAYEDLPNSIVIQVCKWREYLQELIILIALSLKSAYMPVNAEVFLSPFSLKSLRRIANHLLSTHFFASLHLWRLKIVFYVSDVLLLLRDVSREKYCFKSIRMLNNSPLYTLIYHFGIEE